MGLCNSFASNILERPVITRGHRYWDRVGITWAAYLRWEVRVGFRARHKPRFSRPLYKERNKAVTSNLNATKKASDNENVHYEKTYGGIPVSHPA